MYMLNDIAENRLIASLAGPLRRSPRQANALHQTDAEIVRLTEDCTLAISTDTIAEEIAVGLYADPWLIGWMAATVNVSDLAAVGAAPAGIVISETFPHGYPQANRRRLQQGVQDACNACGTFVLGGDTNAGSELSLTGTAVGLCPGGRFLSRTGCAPGEYLFSSGPLGCGNAFALSVFSGTQSGEHQTRPLSYNPQARVREGGMLLDFATSCMDTSDGVLATLDQMMRLNRMGFDLGEAWTSALKPEAAAIAHAKGIPPWLLLAGEHGEYELIFTVPEGLVGRMLQQASEAQWHPLLLGQVVGEPGIWISLEGDRVPVDTARIRNMDGDAAHNIGRYVGTLLAMDAEMKKGLPTHANG